MQRCLLRSYMKERSISGGCTANLRIRCNRFGRLGFGMTQVSERLPCVHTFRNLFVLAIVQPSPLLHPMCMFSLLEGFSTAVLDSVIVSRACKQGESLTTARQGATRCINAGLFLPDWTHSRVLPSFDSNLKWCHHTRRASTYAQVDTYTTMRATSRTAGYPRANLDTLPPELISQILDYVPLDFNSPYKVERCCDGKSPWDLLQEKLWPLCRESTSVLPRLRFTIAHCLKVRLHIGQQGPASHGATPAQSISTNQSRKHLSMDCNVASSRFCSMSQAFRPSDDVTDRFFLRRLESYNPRRSYRHVNNLVWTHASSKIRLVSGRR